jgi:hypothetical protein
MTQPVPSGDTPASDFIGWAFSNLRFWQNGEVVAIAVIIIALFLYLTVLLFMKLPETSNRQSQIYAFLAVFIGFLIVDIWIINLGSEYSAVKFLLWLVLNNLWWPFAIVFPTFFVYSEIRNRKLWLPVAFCFIFKVIIRYEI